MTKLHLFLQRAVVCGLAAASTITPCRASSHREAPSITKTPKLDGADFYMFTSYETGRSNYVTFIADYLPLQDAYGGPNYFQLDENGLYEIEIDNTGDAQEDLTFQFRFQNTPRNDALVIGPAGNQRTNAVPVLAVGPVTSTNQAALNIDQTYTLTLVRGPRRTGAATPLTNSVTGLSFTKPQDYVGTKTFPDYIAYANTYMYTISLPGTTNLGRVFVGQRQDPFVVNLGETFDLVNISTSPLGPLDANTDSLAYKNITALCLELPKDFLVAGNNPIIGAWTTANAVSGTNITQVSRLSMPLVNEVVIGYKDKDNFNASQPVNDGQFLNYVAYPTLPAILELLYGSAGVKAPTLFPRSDLVEVFLTGVPGLNVNGSTAEMQRLNTLLPALPSGQQNNLGVIGGDTAGFPNGRRPGDDVVDVALRVVMGVLLSTNNAPSGQLPFTDGATVNAGMFPAQFPYLNPPIAGSPNTTVTIGLQTSAAANGVFQSIRAGYDAATGTLTVPQPGPATGFLKANADRNVELANPVISGGNITVQVK